MDPGTLGGTYSNGLAINPAGQVTAYATLAGDVAYHAFLSNGGPMTDLMLPNSGNGGVLDRSSAGFWT